MFGFAKNLTGKNPDGFDTVMKKMQDKALDLNSAKRKPLVDALESSNNDLTDAVLQFPDGTGLELATGEFHYHQRYGLMIHPYDI